MRGHSPQIFPGRPARGLSARGAALGALVVLLLVLLSASPARAATASPPPNDNRDNAQNLGALPASVSGTTVGSTLETNEPGGACGRYAGSVWYSVTIPSTAPGTVGVRLSAGGQLDGCADVFIKQRSQDIAVTGARTDANGLARLTFTPKPGVTYLIRVGQQGNSDPGPFGLKLFSVAASARAPGKALPARGGQGNLDSFFTTTAAYSTQLTAAVTYKLNLVNRAGGCMSLSIYGPGTTSFDGTPVSDTCGGYRLFTPTTSGRYSFLIRAAHGIDAEQPFALHVARATDREMAPGIDLPNLTTAHGLLRGADDDVVRLYRINVDSYSQLTLRLNTGADADLELLDSRGRHLSGGGETLTRITHPGTFYAVVRAEDFGSGRFTLERQSRTITHLEVAIDGARDITLRPGESARVSASVSPAVDGTVVFETEYFDPVAGWQYRGTTKVPFSGGVASYDFTAPTLGRWRVTASFAGTRTAAPSSAGWANLLDADPFAP